MWKMVVSLQEGLELGCCEFLATEDQRGKKKNNSLGVRIGLLTTDGRKLKVG